MIFHVYILYYTNVCIFSKVMTFNYGRKLLCLLITMNITFKTLKDHQMCSGIIFCISFSVTVELSVSLKLHRATSARNSRKHMNIRDADS